MRLNTRIMLESVIVSAFLIVVFMIWQIIQGFVNTRKVMQSIPVTTVSETEQLSAEVSFDMTHSVGWIGFLGGFLFMAFIYYGVRIVISRTGK